MFARLLLDPLVLASLLSFVESRLMADEVDRFGTLDLIFLETGAVDFLGVDFLIEVLGRADLVETFFTIHNSLV